MENNKLRTKADYKRFAKSEGKALFYIETNAKHLNELSWSVLGVCTVDEQKELYDFYQGWEERRVAKLKESAKS